MWRFIVILLFTLPLVACGTPVSGAATATITAAPAPAATSAASADPCPPSDLQAYRAAYSDVYNRWGVALIAAGKARPEDLKTPIEQLRGISSELSTLKPPACAQQANAETTQAMKQIIEGYQSLMAGKEVGQMLSYGIDMLSLARAKVNALPAPLAPTATHAPTQTPQATTTPSPTVTPSPTITPTATPTPRNGVIDAKQAQLYETAVSTVPIKTLFQGTRVVVLEGQKGRFHIRVGSLEGWISQGTVVIR